MKKSIAFFLIILLFLSTFFGCASPSEDDNNKDKKLSIVVTTFPQYDWVREILGDQINNVELTLMLDSGTDLHNFQPTVKDIALVSNCDMFIYVGGESDTWVKDALSASNKDDMVIINLLEALGDSAKEEEIVDGMEHKHDSEEHEHEEESHDEHDNVTDEHVWLSLRNAQKLCTLISSELSKLDADNEQLYFANAEKYNERLAELDAEYEKTINASKGKYLLFADRFPFRYLTDDYNLEYSSAFAGCSAETEASFETIVFLSKKIDELALHSVMVIEGSDQSIAKTIINNSKEKNQEILVIDSLQSVTAKDISSGTTYLSVMEKNLEVLSQALK